MSYLDFWQRNLLIFFPLMSCLKKFEHHEDCHCSICLSVCLSLKLVNFYILALIYYIFCYFVSITFLFFYWCLIPVYIFEHFHEVYVLFQMYNDLCLAKCYFYYEHYPETVLIFEHYHEVCYFLCFMSCVYFLSHVFM